MVNSEIRLNLLSLIGLFTIVNAISAFGQSTVLPYSINNPDTIFSLPDDLKEISGLSSYPFSENLYAVQDEKGRLYVIDGNNGEVLKKIPFWKEGDYEGVEMIPDGSIWVVKSNGNLYELRERGEEDNFHLRRHKTGLLKQLDIEGIGYDTASKLLLICAKGRPLAALTEGDIVRHVYGVHPENGLLHDKTPYLTIQLKDIQKFILENKSEEQKADFHKFFNLEKDDEMPFGPSGIAVNPNNGDIYIISSVGKTLIVFSKEKQITAVEKLDKDIHRQPEGICFNSNGVLYISTEGKKDAPALLMKFFPK